MPKLTCMFLGGEGYDFKDEKTGKPIVGTSYRFLINGHEVKIKPVKDGAKIVGCELKPAVPVLGELEFNLDSYRGDVVARFSVFTANKV
jgi:hypothetical protein